MITQSHIKALSLSPYEVIISQLDKHHSSWFGTKVSYTGNILEAVFYVPEL
jgi:hypothetical protein